MLARGHNVPTGPPMTTEERGEVDRVDPDGVYNPPGGEHVQVLSVPANRLVFVSGTVSKNEANELVGVGDMERQIHKCLENVEQSLAAAGAEFSNVVTMQIYTTDMEWYLECAGEPKRAFFDEEAVPTSTLVEVERLADQFDGIADGEATDRPPRYLVEIAVTAVIE